MDRVKKSVLVPIIFFSFFQFPLTIKELRRYLWKYELSENEIEEIIKQLPGINFKDGFVWYGDFVNKRKFTEKLSTKFWDRVARWRWIFSNVPFLSQVFISNTLTYDNVRDGSDIDLFLVVRSERLWTARAFLLFWLNLFGLRVRSVNRHAKFSPEFFITERMLDIKNVALKKDYGFSFWLIDIIPIWPSGMRSEHSTFKRANLWLKDELPIAWRSPKNKSFVPLEPSLFRVLGERVLSAQFGDSLERTLHQIQERIIKRSVKRIGVTPEVIITKDMIKLHFNDRRARIRTAIEKGLNEILGED